MTTPATSPASPDLITYEDAATLLGLSVSAIRRAVGMGKLHPVRFPGSSRKYLERGDVLTYPDRRNAPVEESAPVKRGIVGASEASPPLPDAEKLRELAAALSGPTIEALRDAQATSRAGIEGLVRIAFGLALGATGGAGAPELAQGVQGEQGMMTRPK